METKAQEVSLFVHSSNKLERGRLGFKLRWTGFKAHTLN